MKRLAVAALALLAFAGSACSGGKERVREAPAGPRVIRDLDPTELLPGDLDLVVRIDLARMRSALGPASGGEIARRALASGAPLDAGEPEIREALRCADVVWYGTRVADLEAGDHVIIVEGRDCLPELGRGRWHTVRSANGSLRIFDREGEAKRPGTARIINLANRAIAFVSPVELDSVKRVLDKGPDDRRGVPKGEGIVSFDLRAGRLSPGVEKRFPAVGRLVEGLDRMKGQIVLDDAGLRVDAQIAGKTKAGAERAQKFVEALKESLKGSRYEAMLGELKAELVESTVRLKVVVPMKALQELMPREEAAPAPPPK